MRLGRGSSLRVMMVTPRSPLVEGGVERHVIEVGRRLVAAGVQVQVLCGNPGGPSTIERDESGMLIRSMRAWPAKRDYYLAPGIWAEMARDPCDVVHVQSYHTFVAPLAMARALSLGLPYIVTFHGGGHSSRVRNRLRGPQRRAMRPLLARADRLVATARFELEQYPLELGIPSERFVLIPSGTDFDLGSTVPPDSSGGAVFASIGRLERYKGHHRAIAALPYVLRERPDAMLLIVGTGPYESALRRQAAKRKVQHRVQFTSVPPRDRGAMAALLGRVSLVVLLSDFETHPNVALEAAAARRRLLVADRAAGLAELVTDGLARGIDPDEGPERIAGAILEEMARPPTARTVRLTSWAECAESLLEVYRSVV